MEPIPSPEARPLSTAELLPTASEHPTPPLAPPMITDDAMYELVDGERVAMPRMSYYSSRIATRIVGRLLVYLEAHPSGEAALETLFRVPTPADPGRNRRPDAAFVSFDRWPANRSADPYQNAWDVVPDLAVEVVSPSDLAEDLRAKVLEYFAAGVRLVWVVYPINRLADVFESPDLIRVVSGDTELDGGDVLPGFRLRLSSLFDPIPAD